VDYFFKRARGSVSNILRVPLWDLSDNNGNGKAGITIATTDLLISTIADVEATATTYGQAAGTLETIATLGTYAAPTATKARFKEVDATNHPGLYEVQLADARFAVAGAKSLVITIAAAAGDIAQTRIIIDLTDDADVLVRGTLSSVTTQLTVVLSDGPADNDALNGSTIVFQDAATPAQRSVCTISDYVGSTKTATLSAAPSFTVAATDRFVVLAKKAPNLDGVVIAFEGPTLGRSTGTASIV
jgi:hypothetical protein